MLKSNLKGNPMATIDKYPDDWSGPTNAPTDINRQHEWQRLNREWWENNPMRYDQAAGMDRILSPEGTVEFYSENDRLFFSEARTFMPWKHLPFDTLIPFPELASARVLEIGVGLGSHAQLLASHCREYVGIDLTERAVRLTSRRLQLNGLTNAHVVQMDAESMDFPDASFDFVWSWGVIHHSSNTQAIINQIHRVMKPGARVVLMVYHRGFWNYWIKFGIFRGILRGDYFRFGSVHKIVQHHIDGAFARFYSVREFRSMLGPRFRIQRTLVYGMQQEVLVIFPGIKCKGWARRHIPAWITRFFTNTLRCGGFLVFEAIKE